MFICQDNRELDAEREEVVTVAAALWLPGRCAGSGRVLDFSGLSSRVARVIYEREFPVTLEHSYSYFGNLFAGLRGRRRHSRGIGLSDHLKTPSPKRNRPGFYM